MCSTVRQSSYQDVPVPSFCVNACCLLTHWCVLIWSRIVLQLKFFKKSNSHESVDRKGDRQERLQRNTTATVEHGVSVREDLCDVRSASATVGGNVVVVDGRWWPKVGTHRLTSSVRLWNRAKAPSMKNPFPNAKLHGITFHHSYSFQDGRL